MHAHTKPHSVHGEKHINLHPSNKSWHECQMRREHFMSHAMRSSSISLSFFLTHHCFWHRKDFHKMTPDARRYKDWSLIREEPLNEQVNTCVCHTQSFPLETTALEPSLEWNTAVNVAVIKGGLRCEELRLGPVEQPQTAEVKHASPPYPVRLLLQLCQVFSYTEISEVDRIKKRFNILSDIFSSGYLVFGSVDYNANTVALKG